MDFSFLFYLFFFSFAAAAAAASSRLVTRIKGRGVYGNKPRPSPIRITVIGFEQSFGSRAKEGAGERRGEERGVLLLTDRLASIQQSEHFLSSFSTASQRSPGRIFPVSACLATHYLINAYNQNQTQDRGTQWH